MIKTFTLAEMKQLHQIECPAVTFEYFMDNYCHKLLEDTKGLKKVHVIVSPTFKFEYRKTKLEIA